MNIDRLKRILQAPTSPQETGKDSLWTRVEQEIGLSLPREYKSLISAYGTGTIDSFISIFNPFGSNKFVNLVHQVMNDPEGLAEMRSDYPKLYMHDRYPVAGGLMPFGATDNGDLLYWQTGNDSETWPVIVYESRGPKFEIFPLSLTEFLTGILERTLTCALFPDDFPNDRPVFKAYGPDLSS